MGGHPARLPGHLLDDAEGLLVSGDEAMKVPADAGRVVTCRLKGSEAMSMRSIPGGEMWGGSPSLRPYPLPQLEVIGQANHHSGESNSHRSSGGVAFGV